jgi:hypothetical protein
LLASWPWTARNTKTSRDITLPKSIVAINLLWPREECVNSINA